MTVTTDPEDNEPRALFTLAELEGRTVLEIGCGDGRLTWRYADRTAHVTAIDEFEDSIKQAREDMPESLKGQVEIRHTSFDDFAAASPPPAFDFVLLSWSL
jgi:2-polyprenyl-3-methyl-5-hydroxy-6-metoxy-1,4-benzoquinol methylase